MKPMRWWRTNLIACTTWHLLALHSGKCPQKVFDFYLSFQGTHTLRWLDSCHVYSMHYLAFSCLRFLIFVFFCFTSFLITEIGNQNPWLPDVTVMVFLVSPFGDKMWFQYPAVKLGFLLWPALLMMYVSSCIFSLYRHFFFLPLNFGYSACLRIR